MVKKEKCEDKNCPIHGNVRARGRSFRGKVISAKADKTAVVTWDRIKEVPKYERYTLKKTRVQAHNPECVDAKEGQDVKIKECRPLSKTKKFVITEIIKNNNRNASKKEKKDKKKNSKK